MVEFIVTLWILEHSPLFEFTQKYECHIMWYNLTLIKVHHKKFNSDLNS